MGAYVHIDATDGGRFAAWLATPDRSRAPALVLVQYICGVNRMMREIADEFASHGFLTLAPDLFWRQEPGVQLNDDPAHPDEAQTARALALNQGFDDEKGLDDLQTCLNWLRAQARCSGRAGVLGYCLGGRLAFLTAARSDADANVAYYGVNIRKYLSEASQIARPLLLHLAGDDQHCLADERDDIFQALTPNPNVKLFLYEGAGHQFALPGAPRYDPRAAKLADSRSLDFLKEWLVPEGF